MGAVATFDPVAFVQLFPEFASVPTARLVLMDQLAESTLLDNTGTGPVPTVTAQLNLLNLLVAHLLALFGPSVTTGGQGGGTASSPGAPVGRLNTAAQGTVSSGFDYNIPQNPSAPWYIQTKYGAMFWTATARYRSVRYITAGGSGIGIAQDFLSPPVQLPGGL